NERTLLGKYVFYHYFFVLSKYLTLLIEIHPINNVRVLKAVDSCVRVQFLYPVEGRNTSTESHLLLISEDKCELIFCQSRVADDLIWAQWDMMEQRLFYMVPKMVFIVWVFKKYYYFSPGYNKTFTVSLERTESHQLKEVAFINLDYYVAAYLPGQFLHLLNIQHPDLLCYSLFLTGEDAKIDMLQNCSIRCPLMSTVLDCHIGSMYAVSISESALLHLLQNSKRDNERLAALHCALLYFQHTEDLEMQIIWWISENLSTCHSFDPIQEFIIASLYCRMCPETHNLDKLLPYTSLLDWIGCSLYSCFPCNTLQFQNSKDFWKKLNSNLESVKYAEPHLHYHNSVLRREWRSLSEEVNMNALINACTETISRTASKVGILKLNVEELERLVPLFQEEDYQQQLLMGLMVAQLKDHLMRHLQYVGKKKIDQIVLDYVANLLNLVHQIMKEVWRRHHLHSCIFCFNERGSAGEFAVFHIMSRILEAANGMCLPLPPGFHTLHLGLGVRCLPLHTLLHYIDNGVLHLTETCVRKLLKDLDDTEKNEKLKFSIVMRLPEVTNDFGCCSLDFGADRQLLLVHRIKLMEGSAVLQPGHRYNLNLHLLLVTCRVPW
uniref:Gamma-secretase activating protein n=1 Tax=Strigops habroptila TaxID=2489341 RepID=A0A672UBM5_STRHB